MIAGEYNSSHITEQNTFDHDVLSCLILSCCVSLHAVTSWSWRVSACLPWQIHNQLRGSGAQKSIGLMHFAPRLSKFVLQGRMCCRFTSSAAATSAARQLLHGWFPFRVARFEPWRYSFAWDRLGQTGDVLQGLEVAMYIDSRTGRNTQGRRGHCVEGGFLLVCFCEPGAKISLRIFANLWIRTSHKPKFGPCCWWEKLLRDASCRDTAP